MFSYVYLSTHVLVSRGTHGAQKGDIPSSGAGVASYLIQVLGTGLRSPGRAASALLLRHIFCFKRFF